MKSTVRKFVYNSLSFLNRVVPKRNQVMIYGADCLYDNNEAIFEALNDQTDMNIICIADQHRKIKCRNNVRFVKDNIWNAIWFSLTSRVIIDSFFHAIRVRPCRGQKSIQLWHGTPLKRIDHHKGDNNSQYYTHIIYPSEAFRAIYEKTFECANEKLFLCGNPRNDLLFEPKLGPLEKEGINHYIIWMPTYRHGFGQQETEKDLPVLTEKNIDELNETLAKEGSYLFIKPHPRQTESFENIVTEMSNIGLISDNVLRNANIPLYSFIGAMDALLTDYSSVYFDYLLLNRPIGFVIDDYEEYKQSRGLYFDDPLSMMPGGKIYNLDQLCDFIHSLGKQDLFVEERKRVNGLVNHYQDDQNCKRILDLIQQ